MLVCQYVQADSFESCYSIIHKGRGPDGKSMMDKLDSSMLNQVTLLVNYSYNSFYDFCSSENTYKVMSQNMGVL